MISLSKRGDFLFVDCYNVTMCVRIVPLLSLIIQRPAGFGLVGRVAESRAQH